MLFVFKFLVFFVFVFFFVLLRFKNVMVDIMERDVCFNVGTVWMIKPVTTLMEHVQVDVCQDGRTQRSVKNVRKRLETIVKNNLYCVHQYEISSYLY